MKQYLRCECGCTVVSIDRIDWDESDYEVSLLLYGQFNTGWKDRLIHIWSIIKHGHPHATQEVLLSPSEAIRMGDLLTNAAIKWETA